MTFSFIHFGKGQFTCRVTTAHFEMKAENVKKSCTPNSAIFFCRKINYYVLCREFLSIQSNFKINLTGSQNLFSIMLIYI